MPQFLVQAAYTPQSWATQVRHQPDVRDRIRPVVEACGGSLDTVYYAFGDYDIILLADFPSPEEAAAFSLAAAAGGALKSIKTTPLLTVDQGLAAMARAAEASKVYRPPVDQPAEAHL